MEFLGSETGKKRRAPASASLLLVGDIDFDAEVAAAKEKPGEGFPVRKAPRSKRLFAFPRLDFTRNEILAVADTFEEMYPEARLKKLRRDKATEEVFRNDVSRHRFVHLATHGFFAPEKLKSVLRRTEEEPSQGFGPSDNLTGWHPGLLSGIVFAGANRETEIETDDGILTALELAPLDLRETELLVRV